MVGRVPSAGTSKAIINHSKLSAISHSCEDLRSTTRIPTLTLPLRGSCTHTNRQALNWWKVELGAEVNIHSIVISGRGDCCQYRLKGALVGDRPRVATRPCNFYGHSCIRYQLSAELCLMSIFRLIF